MSRQPLFTLRKNRFGAWLRRQHPDDIVGYARTGRHCPIAEFILRETGSEWAQVGEGHYAFEGSPVRKTPPWASAFIARIDSAQQREISIRAQLALDILEGI